MRDVTQLIKRRLRFLTFDHALVKSALIILDHRLLLSSTDSVVMLGDSHGPFHDVDVAFIGRPAAAPGQCRIHLFTSLYALQ